MKIILHSIVAGPDGVYQPGQRDVPDALAKRLIAANVAVPDDGKLHPTVLIPTHETNAVAGGTTTRTAQPAAPTATPTPTAQTAAAKAGKPKA